MDRNTAWRGHEALVGVGAGAVTLEGNLNLPDGAPGVVLFAHGSGSSRHSPRNRYVAAVLQEAGIATLLVDLLTPEEEDVDLRTGHLRFDIGLLAERLVGATEWLPPEPREPKPGGGQFRASHRRGAAPGRPAGAPDRRGARV